MSHNRKLWKSWETVVDYGVVVANDDVFYLYVAIGYTIFYRQM